MTVALHNIDAERMLLGALFVNPARLADVTLAPEDFYDPTNRAIFEALHALRAEAPDAASLAIHMRAAGTITDRIAARITDIDSAALSAANLGLYAGKVAEHATRRRLAAAAEKIGTLATEARDDVTELVDEAEREVFAVARQVVSDDTVGSEVAVVEAIQHLQHIRQQGELSGLTTGLPTLDKRTTGMQPSELWVLAARPGVGKTALATEISMAAADTGAAVLSFNLEMQRKELVLRAMCARAKLPLETARSGRLANWDMDRLNDAGKTMYALPILWNHAASITLAGIRAEARRAKQRNPKLGLVVVDYLQLVTGSAKSRDAARHLEVAEISRGLKLLAGELGVTVLALSQLSRDVEKGKRRPMLSDLRESGAVEQDANVVLFLHRANDDKPSGDNGAIQVELIVAKQRNGPTGILPVTFCSRFTGFEDGGWQPEPPPPADAERPRTFASKHARGTR